MTTTNHSSTDREDPLTNTSTTANPIPASTDPNADLEAGPTAPEYASPRESSEAPPDYKEHDMPEPLPPYMTRVRGVMRRERPIAEAMPVMQRRTAFRVVGAFALLVLIVIGVGVGIRVANDGSRTNPP